MVGGTTSSISHAFLCLFILCLALFIGRHMIIVCFKFDRSYSRNLDKLVLVDPFNKIGYQLVKLINQTK